MKYSNDKLFSAFRLKYVKVLCLKSILFFLIFSCEAAIPNDSDPIRSEDEDKNAMLPVTGASHMEEYLPILQGKSVGLVGNQTSVVGNQHLVDTLLVRGVKLTKVFSPEHGFRGDADAGEHVTNQKDEKTGLPIISLYGNNKKPRKDQLEGIDIMVFDIQDVGVRFYTYISTLHYVMEACAESNIPLVILDRPNPNGHYVDGPVLDTANFRSFVGMHPVPIVHGMTIGEYGQMINGEKWLKNGVQCDLTVIKCKYYNHYFRWKLDIPPSPNLRSDLSISLYPSLCLLEATDVTVGRGTDHPFEIYGHPDFPDTLNYSFVPKPNFGAKDPKHQGKVCYGFKPSEGKYKRMNELDLSFLINSYSLLDGDIFKGRKKRMFYLLYGSDEILNHLKQGRSEEEIKATWKEDLKTFKLVREKYLLYR